MFLAHKSYKFQPTAITSKSGYAGGSCVKLHPAGKGSRAIWHPGEKFGSAQEQETRIGSGCRPQEVTCTEPRQQLPYYNVDVLCRFLWWRKYYSMKMSQLHKRKTMTNR